MRAIEMEKLRHFVADASKAFGLVLTFLIVSASGAMASLATPWQLGVQDPVSPVAVRIHAFHDYLLVLIVLITVFVLGLKLFFLGQVGRREGMSCLLSRTLVTNDQSSWITLSHHESSWTIVGG